MKSLFVEGNSAMHRLSARAKLVALAAVGVLLFLSANLLLLALAVLATAAIYFSIGLPTRSALARLKPIFLTILIVALFSLAFNPWHLSLIHI